MRSSDRFPGTPHRMDTSRTVIARLESGRCLPSTRTLKRFAAATGSRLPSLSFPPLKSRRASKGRRRARRDRYERGLFVLNLINPMQRPPKTRLRCWALLHRKSDFCLRRFVRNFRISLLDPTQTVRPLRARDALFRTRSGAISPQPYSIAATQDGGGVVITHDYNPRL